MAGDGFLMNRCLNCGRYQHATDIGGFDFSWIRNQTSRIWKRLKGLFVANSCGRVDELGGLNLSCESNGGVQ
jgi:hypothetical protein